MFPKSLVLALGLALTTPWSVAQEEEKILNIYNWSDYIAEDTILSLIHISEPTRPY